MFHRIASLPTFCVRVQKTLAQTLIRIYFFAWTSRVTAMLSNHPLRRMNLEVDHGHSQQCLILCTTLI